MKDPLLDILRVRSACIQILKSRMQWKSLSGAQRKVLRKDRDLKVIGSHGSG